MGTHDEACAIAKRVLAGETVSAGDRNTLRLRLACFIMELPADTLARLYQFLANLGAKSDKTLPTV